MASQDKSIYSEDSSDSFGSNQAIDESTPKIFKEIFDGNIESLRQRLSFVDENRYGDVWSNKKEKHVKKMKHYKVFVSDVLSTFRLNYASVKDIVEGSACDKFQNYILERFNSAVGQTNINEKSFVETKQEFNQKISNLKETFEEKEVNESPSTKSDIDDVILKSKLLDPVHINHALLCCRVAYECKDLEKPEQCLKTFPDKHWLSELVVSYQTPEVPRYVMARCGDVLYVAFRGLENTAYAVASGSVKQTTTWRGQISSIIYNEVKKVPLGYFAREIVRNKRVVFTGHSTGGAIASLVAITLLHELRGMHSYIKDTIKCITFGITPVGDKNLKELVQSIPAMKECFCHIVKHDDIIPKLFGSNLEAAQDCLLDVVVNVVQVSAQIVGGTTLPGAVGIAWSVLVQNVSEQIKAGARKLFFPLFDIFGEYYVLNPTKEPKFKKFNGEGANGQLLLEPTQITENYKAYLVNHRIERYDSDVRQCLVNEYAEDLKHLVQACSDPKKPEDIFPVVEDVQFEKIGDEMMAKVNGKNMWFVHAVTIRGLEPLSAGQKRTSSMKTKVKGESFPVNISKNTECVAHVNMGSTNLVVDYDVNVRVKMHFQDSRYLEAKDVGARISAFEISKRQDQLAKLSPTKVIELAHLSALLERGVSPGNGKDDGDSYSRRYDNVKEFFEGIISVVPVESLFHAMAVSQPCTVVQCCQLLLAKETFFHQETVSSKFLRDGVELALKNLTKLVRYTYTERLHNVSDCLVNRISARKLLQITSDNSFTESHPGAVDAIHKAMCVLRNMKFVDMRNKPNICGLNIEEVYTPSQDENSFFSIENPLTLLRKGRDELNALSMKMSKKTSSESSTEDANSEMLKKLNDLREKFQTCCALLGSFMEIHVHVPLELQDDIEARKIASIAESGGLTVWMLLVLPISYVKKFMRRLLKESRQIVVDVSSYIRNLYDGFKIESFDSFDSFDSYYAGKLEFLMTSMKKSSSSNKSFIAYSLERQLVVECKKRNITYETRLETIVQQWEANFAEEVLTMVDEDYRPMISRWIKWSLMINKLRESLAEQTAVGVIGLVNSGKSKFVESMFGIETISGTVAEKRTTVPYIYNLYDKIEGLDVIDFPGVDDKDKSISELAKLLLTLTRIVVFVVDYKRAHTAATAQWLEILEKENVPVLVCLSFADKLFAEHMEGGPYPKSSDVKKRLKIQLEKITTHVGQPKNGKRDFEFVVFDFDNDSCLNSEEGKKNLRHAGLHDEIFVGRWMAEMLRDNKDEKLANRICTYIAEKKTSTLNCIEKPRPVIQKRSKSKSEGEPAEKADVSKRSRTKKRRKSLVDRAMCSKDLPTRNKSE